MFPDVFKHVADSVFVEVFLLVKSKSQSRAIQFRSDDDNSLFLFHKITVFLIYLSTTHNSCRAVSASRTRANVNRTVRFHVVAIVDISMFQIFRIFVLLICERSDVNF